MVRFLLVLALASSLAQAKTLETYGDSITAGFLSGMGLTQDIPLEDVDHVLADMTLFIMTKDRRLLEPYHRRDLAWPSQILQKVPHAFSKLSNFAVTKAKTIEMKDQVTQMEASISNATAFFFIGHNDLCSDQETPEGLAEKYISEYTAALDEWENRHSNSTAVLLGVGEIYRVYPVLQNQVWHQPGKYSCHDSWDVLFPYCRRYHKLQEQGQLQAELAPKIQAMNESLKRLAEERRARYGNRFTYMDSTSGLAFEPDFFAIDCFHLSGLGQQNLANAIYQKAVSNGASGIFN